MSIVKENTLVKLEILLNDISNFLNNNLSRVKIILSTSECVEMSPDINLPPIKSKSALRFDTEDGKRFVQLTYNEHENHYVMWFLDMDKLDRDGISQIASRAWEETAINTKYCQVEDIVWIATLKILTFLLTGEEELEVGASIAGWRKRVEDLIK